MLSDWSSVLGPPRLDSGVAEGERQATRDRTVGLTNEAFQRLLEALAAQRAALAPTMLAVQRRLEAVWTALALPPEVRTQGRFTSPDSRAVLSDWSRVLEPPRVDRCARRTSGARGSC